MSHLALARRVALAALASALASACGSSTSEPAGGASPSGYAITTANGAPLAGVAGDALRLSVVRTMSDGTSTPLSPLASVTWTSPATVTALPGGSSPTNGILPPPGAAPSAMWIVNPEHFGSAELAGVLWVLDAGAPPMQTLRVVATVVDAGVSTEISAAIALGPTPAGDVTRGKSTYAANCAACHGDAGQGTAKFPGLNGKADNLAGDPAWNPALMAITSRSDLDNRGVSLDAAMPKWLTRLGANGNLLTTSDFADIYAWLKTQSD